MKLKTLGLAVLAMVTAVLPATAHHSVAMFDSSKAVTIEGTVKRFQWTNPHSWITLTVVTKGKPQDWPIELGSPGGLSRQGWVPKTLTPGMKVKIVVHPLRDGQIGGQFLAVTLPDGKQLGDPTPRDQRATN